MNLQSELAQTSAPARNSLFDVRGKTVMVTGAARGLGKFWAQGFSDLGARVIAVDANSEALEALLDQMPADTVPVVLDVTSSSAVDRLGQKLTSAAQPVDVLINSAGVTHLCEAENFPDAEFDRVVSTNLGGTFHMCKMAGGLMLKKGAGSVINVASIGGLIAYPNAAAYVSSKGGVVQLTKALAVEWAAKGIRVNAIAPARVETGFINAQDQDKREVAVEFIDQRQIQPDLLEAKDLLGPALFLASDASLGVNGHVLAVDNGYLAA